MQAGQVEFLSVFKFGFSGSGLLSEVHVFMRYRYLPFAGHQSALISKGFQLTPRVNR